MEFMYILWDFQKVKIQVFNPYISWNWPSAGRPDGRPLQKSVDRSGRPTCINVHDNLGWRAVDRPENSALCFQFPVDRPVDRRHNGHKYDRWPVDRPVDRKGNLGFSRLQRAEFLWVYKYPLLELISPRFQERKIYIFQVFFSNSFWVKNCLLYTSPSPRDS